MSSDQAPGRKRRGAGRVTLNTVARQAGVSAITVSRYFNPVSYTHLTLPTIYSV